MTARASQGGAGGLSPCGAIARRHDPDRFLAALLAPAARREAVFTLVALHHEVSRGVGIAAAATGGHGDFGARVRLQWWREVLEGAAPRHEVATPLAALLAAGAVDPATLMRLVDRAEAALSGDADAGAWLAGMRDGPGALSRATGEVLELSGPALDAVEAAGTAYGIGLALRRGALPATVPREVAIAAGRDALRAAARGPRPDRAGRAAALPATLARRDLDRAAADGRPRPAARGLGDRLALIGAGLFGSRAAT